MSKAPATGTTTLSVSGYNLYTECGEKYRLQNIEKLRPIVNMSWFIYGNAFDEGANTILLGRPDLAKVNAQKVLARIFKEPTEFIKKDYDGELLNEVTKANLLERAKADGYPGESIDALVERCFDKGYKNLSDRQREALTQACYESLREKLFLMLDAFERQIMPMIISVEGVQTKIAWTDDKGHAYRGVLDLPADIVGYGPLVADNKTSSNPAQDYPENSVRESMQLAVYAKVTGKSKGAYFVFDKQIRKNRVKVCQKCSNEAVTTAKTCNVNTTEVVEGKVKKVRCDGEWTETIKPECIVTIRIDDISDEQKNLCQSALTSVADAIAANVYPKNLKSCVKTFGFGERAYEVKCPYYNKCRFNSDEGLKKSEYKKEVK